MAYTAQEIAAKQHFSGKDMAKVVMLEVDDKLVMGVLPVSLKVHVDTGRASLGASSVRLATEDEFTARFPHCEIGAMPPFGNLFGLQVVVDPALGKDEYIYFNAGNHVQTVRMKYKDFADLVKPHLGQLSRETRKWASELNGRSWSHCAPRQSALAPSAIKESVWLRPVWRCHDL